MFKYKCKYFCVVHWSLQPGQEVLLLLVADHTVLCLENLFFFLLLTREYQKSETCLYYSSFGFGWTVGLGLTLLRGLFCG